MWSTVVLIQIYRKGHQFWTNEGKTTETRDR